MSCEATFCIKKRIRDMETKVKAHTLRINNREALATCSCDGWTLQGFSELFAKKNHHHHIVGLPPAEKGTKKP